jgi:hypothetical protein
MLIVGTGHGSSLHCAAALKQPEASVLFLENDAWWAGVQAANLQALDSPSERRAVKAVQHPGAANDYARWLGGEALLASILEK